MVVFSKLVVMHICYDWWVRVGGFSHPLLNPCAVETFIMVVFSKLVVKHTCSNCGQNHLLFFVVVIGVGVLSVIISDLGHFLCLGALCLRKFCICDCMFCVTCGDILLVDPLGGIFCLCVNVKCGCVLELFCCEVKLWGRGFLG